MYKGVILEESLDNKDILNLVTIIKTERSTLTEEEERGFLTFHYFELKEENKKEFLEKAKTAIKDKFYLHIGKDNSLIVVFRNKIFEVKENEKEKLEEIKQYGISIGIKEEQMPSEGMIRDAWG